MHKVCCQFTLLVSTRDLASLFLNLTINFYKNVVMLLEIDLYVSFCEILTYTCAKYYFL